MEIQENLDLYQSSYERKREQELFCLAEERPSKISDAQGYYTYRAREEQLKYELDFVRCGIELLRSNLYEAMTLYGHALNHLKRRDQYEAKMVAIWLQNIKGQKNPPNPDFNFINTGISTDKLV